ncbi:MAG: cell division protein FtsH, partial [Gemmatimonadetes bacterium]|nr:cell division protein FtsH [Gemmatimonadota bacterium]
GRALGITASLPEEDRHTHTKEWLEGQLTMLFGGRVAEEMIFGHERVTTGAGNDIERATGLARRMVTRFGMSELIGLMAVGESEQEVFLGRELGHRREVSEHTAQLVDQEVKRILDEAHGRARTVIEEHKDLMERIAQALLERETLDRAEIKLLADGEPLPPMEVPGEDEAPPTLAAPEGSWGRLGGEGSDPGRALDEEGAVDSGERSGTGEPSGTTEGAGSAGGPARRSRLPLHGEGPEAGS